MAEQITIIWDWLFSWRIHDASYMLDVNFFRTLNTFPRLFKTYLSILTIGSHIIEQPPTTFNYTSVDQHDYTDYMGRGLRKYIRANPFPPRP